MNLLKIAEFLNILLDLFREEPNPEQELNWKMNSKLWEESLNVKSAEKPLLLL